MADPALPTMQGLPAESQARLAIRRILERCRDNPHIGHYFPPASIEFGVLCESYASLTGQPIEEVRARFACKRPQNPHHKQLSPEASAGESAGTNQ